MDHLSSAWGGGGRHWWPSLCNEVLSDHIGYLITELSDVSLEDRTLEMQRIDPIASLIVPVHQMPMAKGLELPLRVISTCNSK